MPRRRVGVVLLVRPPWRDEIDVLRRAVGDPTLGRIPAHLTLVPPVNVRDDEMGAARDLLRWAGEAMRPITVTLGPPTTFLPTNPVLFLGVHGDVAAVDRARDLVFKPPLERPLTWPFHPHVTLLDNGDEARIVAAVDALADLRMEVTFPSVHLLEETRRGDDGARVWNPIFEARFEAPAVIGRGGLELALEVTGEPTQEARAFSAAAWEQHDVDRWGEVRPPFEQLTVVARRDGRIVGVATGEIRDGDDAYLADLVVDRSVRGEGIGAHLLAAFESEAAARGATYATLRTGAGERQHGFYLRHGYADWYPLPDWRGGRDFVQMRKNL
jgi:GNAT superfamily N-acetyltransferase/2'-5' RNA ligase